MAASLLMLSCSAALAGDAADDDMPRWTLGGFGTLGVAHSNEDQADFTSNALVRGDAGASRRWSVGVDSRVGSQASVEIDRQWSAVLQVVSERTLDNGYRPAVEWAYVQYKVTPDLSLRLGRIALPLFLAGDYRKAGYTVPWVRTPVELYGAIPLASSDGVDASYRWQSGEINHVTQAFLGHADLTLSPVAHVRARRLAGLSNTTTAGALTLRASMLTSMLTVDLAQPLFDGLRAYGDEGEALVRRYELADKRAYVASLGFSYDPGTWFAMGEIGRLNSRSYLGDKSAGYLSVGYRHRNLTPYLVYSASHPNMQTQVDGLDLSQQTAARSAAGAQLNAGLNQLLAAVARQYTVGVGVRWDLHPNYALKLQYDRVTPQQGSTGTFINVQPGFRSGQPIAVLSAALDFVF
ncbi:hypothetical protein [Duganella guangzhouensis]|nr:hypothetical protein [Duganella guangzhouensis]